MVLVFLLISLIVVRANILVHLPEDELYNNELATRFKWLTYQQQQKRTIEVTEDQFTEMQHLLGKRLVLYYDTPCRTNFHRCQKSGYKNFDELTTWLKEINKDYPDLTRLFSFGTSVSGRPLWALEISDKPGDQTELEPNFKYVANMHGDEITGQVMLQYLTQYLLKEYTTNSRIKSLVDDYHIFIIPLLNPDGFSECMRENKNGIDLNRNFPDQFYTSKSTTTGREPETVAIMNLMKEIQFTLSANMHGGEVVVNYPFDAGDKRTAHSDDEDVFIEISLTYSRKNPPMYKNKDYSEGIINGATWYAVHGGMQDWNYVWAGCMETTLELSCDKWPPISDMPRYWEENRESLLDYIEILQRGVRGLVRDVVTGNSVVALIQVQGRNHKIYSDNLTGKYFRILLPGTYILMASAEGYFNATRSVTIESSTFVRVDFSMVPLLISEDISYNVLYRYLAILTLIGLSILLILLCVRRRRTDNRGVRVV